ncbi:PREDICTED: uncharacterized protein LOC109580575 [Amphimedon queenslandica]|uniref:Uncharacterized protein n=1 Tax=Amphimedon queenslandica TaxID=400682 RepID=A0AAN0IXF9_AMPQE|nr:PREDICTED: uncharacterized protein LOC109580575 [Amphimedon queenslandica]|eukprot:XP_019849454.1 PREDICTED: uncharacterized protein LOC109580575 [Amphimedon queenslandica]
MKLFRKEYLTLGSVSLKDFVDNLQKQIRILSILNHETSWHLSVKDGLNISYNHEREPVHSIRGSPFKILSSVKHFINDYNPQSKLKIYRGQSFTIPNYAVESNGGERIEVDLKLYSCVSVIPSLRLSRGKKVPADRVCSELHVNIYVTGNVPLYSTEEVSATGPNVININDVADWTEYGLTIDERRSAFQGAARSSCSPFCFSYYLKTHRTCSLSTSRYKKDRLIIVFIFIELLPTTAPAPHSLLVEEKWCGSISLLTGLRRDFPSLLHEYSNKVHKTIHEGLNKIFCNYSDYGKITDSFSVSLPLLSGAVNDIHRLSVNNKFKKEVAELLETEQDVEQELLKKLNELSEKHSLNDRVPTTPELLVSMNEETSANGTSETGAGINGIRISETRINETETGFNRTETRINETKTGINETETRIDETETGTNETETGINETETGINDVSFSDSECDFDTLAIVPDSDTIIGSIVPDATSLAGSHHHHHYYYYYEEEEEGYDIDQWYDDTPAVVVPSVIQTGSVQTEPSCSSQYEKCSYDSQPDHLMEDIIMTVSPQINELDFDWSD